MDAVVPETEVRGKKQAGRSRQEERDASPAEALPAIERNHEQGEASYKQAVKARRKRAHLGGLYKYGRKTDDGRARGQKKNVFTVLVHEAPSRPGFY